jgi:MOSC domain-containing protein YiiM
MTQTATVVALCVGAPKTLGQDDAPDPFDRSWTSGIFKTPVADPLWLTSTGFSGDGQADLTVHGGPDKAVCVYAAEHYGYWRSATGNESFTFGAFGENLSVEGLDEPRVCIGDVWSVGEAEVEISQPRQPCWKVARKWRRRTLTDEVVSSGYTGWYFRVRREGRVAPGAPLSLLERRHPEWTIAAANRVMHRREGDTAALARLDELSASWRRTLEKRLHAAGPG